MVVVSSKNSNSSSSIPVLRAGASHNNSRALSTTTTVNISVAKMLLMNPLVFAILYLIFALLFVYSNLSALGIETVSQIHETAKKFEISPFAQQPERWLNDIQIGFDIFEWAKTVGLPVLYASAPKVADAVGYCTETSKCRVGEGECGADTDCGGRTTSSSSSASSGGGSSPPATCGDKTAAQSKLLVNNIPWEIADLRQWCEYSGAALNFTKVCQGGKRTAACRQDPGCPDPYGPAGAKIEYLEGAVDTDCE